MTPKLILDLINAARHALNIRMFLFTEPTLLDAGSPRASRGKGQGDAQPGAPQRRD
jgi:hypothetical protein